MTKKPSQTIHEVGGFLVLAVVTYIFYTSIIIASQDILASTEIPTSTIIACLIVPYLGMSIILPYFVDKTNLMAKGVLAGTFFLAAILMITLVKTPWFRLVGVCVASLGIGTAEIGFLSATSLHEELTLHSFTAGTGIGGVLGTGLFTVVTTVFCVNPTTMLLILLIFLPIYPLIPWMITKRARQASPEGDRQQVLYTPLVTDTPQEQDANGHLKLTWKEKLSAAKSNLSLAVPLYIGLFANYTIMNAVMTTIAFENSPLDPRNHFQYYTFTFWASELVGRIYGLIILSIKPNCVVVTKHTWILALILAANLIFLIISSWFRLLPNFGVALLVVCVTGVTEGALYLNTFAVAGKGMAQRYKEFSRAFLTFALSGGIVTAGFMGLWLEGALQTHCQETMQDTSYCFTRSLHGWNASSSCLLL